MCIVCDRIEQIRHGRNPYFVAELKTGYVVIGDYQHFRGYTLFLAKTHKRELFELDPDTCRIFLEEMALVNEAVAEAFGAEKMNCELLGNGDAHLHWHLFPRVAGDLGEYGNQGKGPVWWYPREQMYSEENRPTGEDLAHLKETLRIALEKRQKQTAKEQP